MAIGKWHTPRCPKPITSHSLGIVLLEIALWQTARSVFDGLYKRNKQQAGERVNAYGMQEWCLSRATKEIVRLMGAFYQSAILARLESKFKDQIRRVMTVEKYTLQVGRKSATHANHAEILLDPHKNHYGAVDKSLHPTHSQIHPKPTFLSPFPQWPFWPLLHHSK